MGLLTDSVVVTDNVATILIGTIRRKIGACSVMAQVDVALRITRRV